MNTSFMSLLASIPHTFTVLRTYSQQIIDQTKTADKLYKEILPKYVGIKNKYDDVKRREDQAAEQVKGQKQRVTLLESELEECRKVCNNL